jgi:tellurite methyltransferase
MKEPVRPVAPLLDVRPSAAFLDLHRTCAVNIPLEELAARAYELPPRETAVMIYDDNPVRARWAKSRLVARERCVAAVAHGREWLRAGPVESGPSRNCLWQPHKLLVEALDVLRAAWGDLRGRRALDVACGAGRDAVYLALAGMDVDAWDILPDALAQCDALSARNHVAVHTKRVDVERQADPLGGEQYDLICCFNFLHRPLMPAMAEAVRPGGFIVYETFVDPQREQFGKPSREQHVLRRGELPTFFNGWEQYVYRETLAGPRRFAASLIARKP